MKRSASSAGMNMKRRSYKKRNTQQRPLTAADVIRIVQKTEEKKRFPVFGALGPSTAGGCTDFMAIGQGVNAALRIGDRVTLNELHLRVDLIGSDATQFVRVILFQWFDDSVPIVTDILDTGTFLPMSWLADYNAVQPTKYAIIRDTSTSLSTSTGPACANFQWVIKPNQWPKKQVVYSSASTVGSNKIWLLTISDSLAISHPTVNFAGYVKYTDA